MAQLMYVTIEADGNSYKTVDDPECVGPWIVRILERVSKYPGQEIRITLG